MDLVYFDNSATTKPYKEVVDEVVDCLENFYGNPSSSHKLGVDSEKKIKLSRERVAKIIEATPNEIIFTSGGSESNNMAIKGILKNGDHVIVSSIEHKSVLKVVEDLKDNIEVTILPVLENGVVDLEKLKSSIKSNTKLVSIMHVNNEIGVIQPIKDIVGIVREKSKKAKIHVDAVQSLGKVSIDVKDMDVDFLSLSAHKIHGPKGVGALYIKKGLVLKPLISGGGQENNLRGGTENIPAISGFGVACRITLENFNSSCKNVKAIKERFISLINDVDDIIINSPISDIYVNNILSISFGGIRGEVLLHSLEDYNVFVSTGSACSAKKATDKNYVLPSLGLSEKHMKGTIRFSFSSMNTLEEVDHVVEAVKKALPFLRRIK